MLGAMDISLERSSMVMRKQKSMKKFVMFAVGQRASAVNYLTCLEM